MIQIHFTNTTYIVKRQIFITFSTVPVKGLFQEFLLKKSYISFIVKQRKFILIGDCELCFQFIFRKAYNTSLHCSPNVEEIILCFINHIPCKNAKFIMLLYNEKCSVFLIPICNLGISPWDSCQALYCWSFPGTKNGASATL